MLLLPLLLLLSEGLESRATEAKEGETQTALSLMKVAVFAVESVSLACRKAASVLHHHHHHHNKRRGLGVEIRGKVNNFLIRRWQASSTFVYKFVIAWCAVISAAEDNAIAISNFRTLTVCTP